MIDIVRESERTLVQYSLRQQLEVSNFEISLAVSMSSQILRLARHVEKNMDDMSLQ
jgi:hypothetical protein